MFWLDERTLLAGRGYRTNDHGIEQIRELLAPAVDVVCVRPAASEGRRHACT